VRVSITEACLPKDKGSFGFHYVRQHIIDAGFIVVDESSNPDVEMISLHHCEDFLRLAQIPRRAPVRIVGGHVMANNYKPAIPYADALCVGEGETWASQALRLLQKSKTVEALEGLPGTVICKTPQKISPTWEPRVPFNLPILRRAESKGHADTWYIEIARGCPFSCAYCELGNTVPYRKQDPLWIKDQIKKIDKTRTKHISLYAPDEASHPQYSEFMDCLKDEGLITMFASARMDQVIRHQWSVPGNMMIRIGLDGLSEKTREKIRKKATDEQIIEYFKTMSAKGHANFKVFLVVGYPWETLDDLQAWIALWERIRSIPRKANAHVRIKVTPLIPQPSTPLKDAKAKYDIVLHERLSAWFQRVKRPRRADRLGWYIDQDGTILSRKRWKMNCDLTAGDESIVERILANV
jgi:radical SAM superfamily enzyme YgiQ (UPF0313 family)